LVDVGLPGIDGYEIARIVRKNPALAGVRLVALTGYGRAEDHDAVLAAGFDEHLIKPVTPDELTRVLRQAAHDGTRTAGAAIDNCQEQGNPLPAAP
jgi:CheY-like chemotaxis protein